MDADARLADLEHRLKAGSRLSWQQAIAEYRAIRGNGVSWQENDWRQRREEFLGSACVQCGSNKQPLVVQHLKHPRSFGQIVRGILRAEWQLHKNNFDDEQTRGLKEERATCPSCTSLHIKQLKSGKWSCYKCRTKCDAPEYRLTLTPKGRTAYARRKRNEDLKKLRWKQFKSCLTNDQGIASLLVLIGETREYLQFKYAVTFCKRCAFAWDKKGIRLCQTCHSNWHPVWQTSCNHCCPINHE